MSTGTNTRTRTVQRTTKRNGTTSRRSMARNSSSGASMFQPIPLPHEEASPCRWIAASPEARCFAMARADGSLVVWQAVRFIQFRRCRLFLILRAAIGRRARTWAGIQAHEAPCGLMQLCCLEVCHFGDIPRIASHHFSAALTEQRSRQPARTAA